MDSKPFYKDRLSLSVLVVFFPMTSDANSIDLTTVAAAPEDDPRSYPLAMNDRPSILPTHAALVTMEGGGGADGAILSTNLGYGLGADCEVTGKIGAKQYVINSYEVGLGQRWLLIEAFDVVGRVALPIYQEGSSFRDVSFGPGVSFNYHSRWVVSGLANLVHLTFDPRPATTLLLGVSIGYQPWERWHFSLATVLGEVGVYHASSSSLFDKVPIEGIIQFAKSITWDVAVKVTNENQWKPTNAWSVSLVLTLKKFS